MADSSVSVDDPQPASAQGHTLIDLTKLPPDVAVALQAFDEHGNGLSVEDIKHAAEKWVASQGHHASFSLKAFPENLQATMKAFDQDGDDTVNGAELAAAARMYHESKNRAKMLGRVVLSLSIVLLLTLVAIMGLVYVVVEMSKETSTGSDGAMSVKGGTAPVRVDTVESMSTVWDLPGMSTNDLAYIKALTIYIDMTSASAVSQRVEATFKLSGAYKPEGSSDKAFVTTPEGYTIEINRSERKGSIDMGSKGKFNIYTDAAADEVGRRLQKLTDSRACEQDECFFDSAELKKEGRQMRRGGMRLQTYTFFSFYAPANRAGND